MRFSGVDPSDWYVASYVTVVIAATGLVMVPVHLASYRERGVLRRFAAAGFPRWSFAIAQLAVGLGTTALASAVLLAVAAPVYGVPPLHEGWRVLAALVLGAVAFVSAGVLLGSLLPSARSAQAVGLILFFPSFLLGAGGPPPAVMGDALRDIAEVLPLSRRDHRGARTVARDRAGRRVAGRGGGRSRSSASWPRRGARHWVPGGDPHGRSPRGRLDRPGRRRSIRAVAGRAGALSRAEPLVPVGRVTAYGAFAASSSSGAAIRLPGHEPLALAAARGSRSPPGSRCSLARRGAVARLGASVAAGGGRRPRARSVQQRRLVRRASCGSGACWPASRRVAVVLWAGLLLVFGAEWIWVQPRPGLGRLDRRRHAWPRSAAS